MRLLTVGVEAGAQHDAQVRLGAYLLWFFLPQLVLYAVGAVATALLNADRRFVAAAIAPAFNNVVVVATMVVFRAMRGDATGLAITTSEKLVLGLGTTLGVVAMTVVPLLALRRGRLFPHIRWHTDLPLHAVARRGAWAVGHLGLNQLLMAATIVLAARVSGGVVAFQIAFTFFLLPHAVLSNPIYTVLYPRLAGDARVGRFELFADDLGAGCRYTAFVLLPAAALLAALAAPALTIVHFGALDEAGARLVAAVLAAYAAGLLGYSGFFLLTRAAYALDDVKGPTIVNFWVTVGAITGMVIASAAAHGEGRVIVLGLVHAIATALGSWALLVRLRRRLDRPVPVGSAIARDTAVATVAGVLAWLATHALDMSSRTGALLAIAIGAAVGGAAYLGGQRLLAAPELTSPFRSLAREPV
jgi:putative peptidoglycan lipid II flippase